MLEQAKRLVWIDYAKAIAIFLVVLAHLPLPLTLTNSIYAFHMPLFFFISGYLFSFKKHISLNSFLRQKGKQLLIPYVTFNIISYIFWYYIGRKEGSDATRNIPVTKPLIGIFYGNGVDDYLVHDIALWFLPCLFVVESFFFIIFRDRNFRFKAALLILIAIIGFIDYKYVPVRLPWSINIAIVALLFYATAHTFKDWINKALQLKAGFLFLTSIPLFILYLYVALLNGRVDMNYKNYQHYGLFLFAAYSGIIAFILLCKCLYVLFNKIQFIEFIAKNTLVILGFQFIALSMVKGFLYFVLKLPLSVISNKFVLNLIVATAAVLLLVPVIILFNNYFPYLIGRGLKVNRAAAIELD